MYNQYGEVEITAYVSSKLLPGTVSIGHGEWSRFDNVRKSKLMPYGIDTAGNCNLLIGDTHLPQEVYKRQIHAPDVLGSPGPAFPRIGLTGLQGIAAQKVEELARAAVRSVDDLRFTVAVDLGQHGEGTVFGVEMCIRDRISVSAWFLRFAR